MTQDPNCLFALQGRVDTATWRELGHPYCELSAAITDAERFTAHYPCVRVINRQTGQCVHEATRVVR